MRRHRLTTGSLEGLIVALTFLAGTGCGDASAPVLAAIVITPADTVITVPTSLTLTAQARTADGQEIPGVEFTWTSLDTTIARVTSAGVVTGAGEGTTQIRATAQGITGSTPVRIHVPVTSLTIDSALSTIRTGATRQFLATATGPGGIPVPSATINWTTSSSTTASIDGTGLAQGFRFGDVTITAMAGSVQATAILRIVPASVVIVTNVSSIPLHGRQRLVVQAYDIHGGFAMSGANYQPVAWTSSNNAIVAIDSAQPFDGVYQGMAAGAAELYATIHHTRSPALPVTVTVMGPVNALGRGVSKGCVIAAGAGWCWGAAFVGDGTAEGREGPVPLAGAHNWTRISVGDFHGCGIVSGGAAYCWGANNSGQLGDGTTTDRRVPTAVAGGHTFAEISAGSGHTCAVTVTNVAYCWGANSYGQLGSGDTAAARQPQPVSGGLAFRFVSTSRMYGALYVVSCGVTTSDAGYCWGSNNDGQLGTGDSSSSLAPRLVTGGIAWRSIHPGVVHGCGVATNGTGYCWGANPYGALGTGNLASTAAPTPVLGGPYEMISAGYLFSCGTASNGDLRCFGNNEANQLGIAGVFQLETPGTPAPGVDFSTAFTGGEGACAVTTAGVLYCWGGSLATPLKWPGQP